MEKPRTPNFSSEDFVSQIRSLAEKAESEALVLRILGGLAIRIHCSEFLNLLQKLGRETQVADVDVITNGEQQERVEPFFKKNGYNPEPRVRRTPAIWAYRQIYVEPRNRFNVDVFTDKLEMSHTLDLRDRLKTDFPTISIADLLLAKMQIQEINEKDIKDTIVLMRAHELADSDKECINGVYIAGLMSKDWGFYHTVTNNLKKTKLLLQDYAIEQSDKNDVISKVDRLLALIENEPKTSGFKIRARIGERKKWYNEVDETIRDVQDWR